MRDAQAEDQLAAATQAGQVNVLALSKTPRLPGLVDGKENLDNYLLRFERNSMLLLRICAGIRGQFDLAKCLLVKQWMFILINLMRIIWIVTS